MPRPLDELRPVHVAVLAAASHGLTAAETAADLNYSTETIKSYRKEAYRILGARNLSHAVALAWRKGIIE